MDYASPEGKALYAELQAADPTFKLLPAALLGQEVDDRRRRQAADAPASCKPLGKYQELKRSAAGSIPRPRSATTPPTTTATARPTAPTPSVSSR
jgi:hypothetical protein